MIKDIPEYKVEDIGVAVVKETNDVAETIWNVYMLNFKKEAINGVLITSKGYGQKDGENVKTSTLRYFIDTLPAQSYARIEPIMEEIFGLTNEYWISFYLNQKLYDKKYIFLAESIVDENLTPVPLINKEGVMII